MPREDRLFGDVVEPSITMGDRQGASVAATIVCEVILVGVFITIPLMATDILPAPPDMMGAFVAAEPPPAPPPPPPASRSASTARADATAPTMNAAPVDAPTDIAPEQPTFGNNWFEHPGSGVVDGVPSGNGVPGGMPDAPPLAVSPAPAVKEPVRVGGVVLAPRKIRDARPVYPRIAQQGRVQGFVILEATIDPRGKVADVRVLRSQPLLDQAAIDAVLQWEFTPTLLNGEPTAIIMNVTVHFQLN